MTGSDAAGLAEPRLVRTHTGMRLLWSVQLFCLEHSDGSANGGQVRVVE